MASSIIHNAIFLVVLIIKFREKYIKRESSCTYETKKS